MQTFSEAFLRMHDDCDLIGDIHFDSSNPLERFTKKLADYRWNEMGEVKDKVAYWALPTP